MSTWNSAHRTFKGTGNVNIDITCYGLPTIAATNPYTGAGAYNLADILKVEFIQDADGGSSVDWKTATNLLLPIISSGAWEIKVYCREGQGLGKVL